MSAARHSITEHGTTRCPNVGGIAAYIDEDDRECSACGEVVLAPAVPSGGAADDQAKRDNHYGYCTLSPLHDGPCEASGGAAGTAAETGQAALDRDSFIAWALVEAEEHREDHKRGGCTCGFCVWSVDHVLVMSIREVWDRHGLPSVRS